MSERMGYPENYLYRIRFDDEESVQYLLWDCPTLNVGCRKNVLVINLLSFVKNVALMFKPIGEGNIKAIF